MKNEDFFFYATLKQSLVGDDRLFFAQLAAGAHSSYYRRTELEVLSLGAKRREWRFYDIWDICMEGGRKIRKQGEARCALNG